MRDFITVNQYAQGCHEDIFGDTDACISKGRFFWFVEGRVLYIYLASGNQKNRPFGAIPLFPRNQPPLKMSPIGIQPPPPADTPSVSKIIS